jgi:hypothetical protein
MHPNQLMAAPQFPMTDAKQVNAAVIPTKFELRYKEQADGTFKAEEWCELAKVGVTIPATTPHKIATIIKAAKKATEPDDEMAAIWRTIQPYYDNWKKGGAADEVINGTPLVTWSGVSKDVVEALRPFNIRSVEDLSIMSDAIMQRVPNPNMALFRDRAKKFLATKDIAVAVNQLTDATAELAKLRAELDEMKRGRADAEFARDEAEGELAEAVPAQVRKRKIKAVA